MELQIDNSEVGELVCLIHWDIFINYAYKTDKNTTPSLHVELLIQEKTNYPKSFPKPVQQFQTIFRSFCPIVAIIFHIRSERGIMKT